MYRLVALALFLGGISPAFAGTVASTVGYVRVDEDGRGIIFFNQPITGPAVCAHSAYLNALAFNTNTVGGKNFLAAALTAKATGATLSAVGKGTCAIYGNGIAAEDLLLAHVM